MRIGEVSRQTGLPTTTIRYYEEIGLAPRPDRAANGYREYDPEAVERLRFVRDAHHSGLTLEEIASILVLRSQGEATCRHVVDMLERHLTDLEARIARLQRSRETYAGLIARARSLDPAACTDPDRCQTISRTPEPIIHADGLHRVPA